MCRHFFSESEWILSNLPVPSFVLFSLVSPPSLFDIFSFTLGLLFYFLHLPPAILKIGFTHLRRVISFSLREFRSTATVPTIENLEKVSFTSSPLPLPPFNPYPQNYLFFPFSSVALLFNIDSYSPNLTFPFRERKRTYPPAKRVPWPYPWKNLLMRTSYLTSTIPPSLPPPPPAAGELQVAPPRVVEVGVGEAVQIPCISPISNVPTAVCWTKILEGGCPESRL